MDDSADPWHRDHLDLLGPAQATFHGDGSPELNDDGTPTIEFRSHLGDEGELNPRP